jgi:hypothetical protein
MKVSLLGVGLLALASTIGFAQAAPAPMQRPATTINQRMHNQQARIGGGIRTGRINARQGARLERREARIQRADYRMRAHNHGRLNHRERVRLNHRLNHSSRAIYRARHNRARQ